MPNRCSRCNTVLDWKPNPHTGIRNYYCPKCGLESPTVANSIPSGTKEKVARVIGLEHLSNHLFIMERWFQDWGDDLHSADRATVVDHIRATERLAKTLDAGYPDDTATKAPPDA